MNQYQRHDLRKLFNNYDSDFTKHVDMWQMYSIIQEYGVHISYQELFMCLVETDSLNEGYLTIDACITVLEFYQRKNQSDFDQEIIYSWCAIGGNNNLSGVILLQDLQQQIDEFHLEIDLEEILHQICDVQPLFTDLNEDLDQKQVDFSDFKTIMQFYSSQ